jgi:hypothetical protein
MDTADLGETFDVPGLIRGLHGDLVELRTGKITPSEAQVRADIAKQIFNGLRLMVQAQRFLSNNAKPVSAIEGSEAAK